MQPRCDAEAVDGGLIERGQSGVRGGGVADPEVVRQRAPTESRVLAPSGAVVEGGHRGPQLSEGHAQETGQTLDVPGAVEPRGIGVTGTDGAHRIAAAKGGVEDEPDGPGDGGHGPPDIAVVLGLVDETPSRPVDHEGARLGPLRMKGPEVGGAVEFLTGNGHRRHPPAFVHVPEGGAGGPSQTEAGAGTGGRPHSGQRDPGEVGGHQTGVVLEAAGGQNDGTADDLVTDPHPGDHSPVRDQTVARRPGSDLDPGVVRPGQECTDEGPAPDRPPEHHTIVGRLGLADPVRRGRTGLVGGGVDPGLDGGREAEGPGPQRTATGPGPGDLTPVVGPLLEDLPDERRPPLDLRRHPAGVGGEDGDETRSTSPVARASR